MRDFVHFSGGFTSDEEKALYGLIIEWEARQGWKKDGVERLWMLRRIDLPTGTVYMAHRRGIPQVLAARSVAELLLKIDQLG